MGQIISEDATNKRPIRKRDDIEGREFWKPAESAAIKVNGWPEWKRNIVVGGNYGC